jgi:cell wall-associated NlpC family hydrolase
LAALKKAQAKKAKKASSQVVSKVSSARLRKVLKYALSQVGDRYSMGATGPSSYDCSGLTMMAYRKAGVSLSHFSAAQWSQTRRVSRSQLRPGDLVFFFRGIRHVGMYIGGGRFVHAASYGTGVVISALSESYYVKRLSGFGRVIQ